ncbi:hypothetical protein, partial [Secundilactobacillus similis]|uniref:hypothetical protein n=1 Tax=Secundilactobacillus similis TaxID=414682 RepID=UPI001F3C1085
KFINNRQLSRHSIHLAADRNLTLAQFGTIAEHLKRLTARSVTELQRLTLIRQTSRLISNQRFILQWLNISTTALSSRERST